MGCVAVRAIVCITLNGAIVANLTTILLAMDCATMKMLQIHLKEKDGQTVRSLGTTSQDFIVVLVETYLEISTNFAAVRWFRQVDLYNTLLAISLDYLRFTGYLIGLAALLLSRGTSVQH